MAEKNNSATTGQLADHSPIVEHLRLVHIVIIIACVVVFAFSVFDDSQVLTQASSEDHELQKILKAWDPGIIEDACRKIVQDKKLGSDTQSIRRHFVNKPGSNLHLETTIEGTTHVVSTRMQLYQPGGFKCTLKGLYDSQYNRTASRVESIGPGFKQAFVPNNLSDLVEYWNYFGRELRVDELLDFEFERALAFNKSALDLRDPNIPLVPIGKGAKVLATVAPGVEVKDLKFASVAIKEGNMHKMFVPTGDSFRWYAILETAQQNFVIVIPIRSKSVATVNIHKKLIDNGGANPIVVKPGDFHQSFPALYSVIEHKLRESPKLIGDLLRKHAEEKTAQVDVFGNKIKVGSILKFGALIIAGLMLYYFLNLRALGYKLCANDNAYSIPWIGIYPDHASLFATVVTVVFIPLAVALLQLKLTFDFASVDGMIISYSVIALLAIVSAFTLFHSLKVYSKVRRFAAHVK